ACPPRGRLRRRRGRSAGGHPRGRQAERPVRRSVGGGGGQRRARDLEPAGLRIPAGGRPRRGRDGTYNRRAGGSHPLTCPSRDLRGGLMAAKILVVDDDPNVQRLLQYTLKQEGYEVVVAGDGAEGFRLWGAEEPDLILLDVMLPKLDGYQVATKIRSEEGAWSHVPIIMLTAEREVEQKV